MSEILFFYENFWNLVPDQVPKRAFPHRNRPVRRFRSPDSMESRRINQELMGNSKRIVSAMGNYSKSQPDVGTSRYEAELREENSWKDDEEEGQFSIPGAEDENEVATMEDTVEGNCSGNDRWFLRWKTIGHHRRWKTIGHHRLVVRPIPLHWTKLSGFDRACIIMANWTRRI